MKILSKDLLFTDNNKVISSDISAPVTLAKSFTDSIFYSGTFYGLSARLASGWTTYNSSNGKTYTEGIGGSTARGNYGCLCPDYTDNGVIVRFITDSYNNRIACVNNNITRYINSYSNVKQCIYANGQYYLVGYNPTLGTGRIHIGSDLSTWQDPINLPSYILGIAYGNGLFVLVCAGSQVYISVDGLNYIRYSTPINGNKIIFAEDYFIIAGIEGLIRSKNGIDWETIYTADDNTGFYSLCYGNKKLVAGGNKIISTIDFKNYKTIATLGNLYTVDNIVYGNNVFDFTSKTHNELYYIDWGIE